jgi:hypothetical protein
MRDHSTEVVVALAIAYENKGLSDVPSIVRALMRMGYPRHEAHLALLTANTDEQIELRPESGFDRVPKEELALCPRMSDGTPLSLCRVLV